MSYDVCMDMLPPLIEEHLAAAGAFEANKLLPICGGDAASLARRNATALADIMPLHLQPSNGAHLAAMLTSQPCLHRPLTCQCRNCMRGIGLTPSINMSHVVMQQSHDGRRCRCPPRVPTEAIACGDRYSYVRSATRPPPGGPHFAYGRNRCRRRRRRAPPAYEPCTSAALGTWTPAAHGTCAAAAFGPDADTVTWPLHRRRRWHVRRRGHPPAGTTPGRTRSHPQRLRRKHKRGCEPLCALLNHHDPSTHLQHIPACVCIVTTSAIKRLTFAPMWRTQLHMCAHKLAIRILPPRVPSERVYISYTVCLQSFTTNT